ncbi:hypothetical protein D9611_001320 [Ephemerocybe angulata]|uniref:F-box domain-containing protein n=1 Tax=Ephemerocybe angulata TaxID=980116 RepID=A0A8H5CK04_9AGAR|nr:hypothetical protein D9611_001320 [Tulosesus angulatus]
MQRNVPHAVLQSETPHTPHHIHHLPPEILATIFLELALDIDPFDNTSHETVPCVLVTHVCSTWRIVALECQALWCNIPSKAFGNELLRTMLDRSKGAPLTIRYRSRKRSDAHPSATSIFGAVTPQLHRLRSLEIRENHHPISLSCAILQEHWSDASAPVLEKLVIVAKDVPYSGLSDSKFLKGGCPNLKHLEVVEYSFPIWEVLPLGTSLTHLIVECHPGRQNHPWPAMDQLWAALKRMRHNLEYLRIGDLLLAPMNQGMVAADQLEREVSLPKLRHLILADVPNPLVSFLRKVTFPKSTSVDIKVHGSLSRSARLLPRVVESLRAAWEGPHDAHASGGGFMVEELNISVGCDEGSAIWKWTLVERDDEGSEIWKQWKHVPSRIALAFADRGDLSITTYQSPREPLSTLDYFLVINAQLDLPPLRILRLGGLNWSFPEAVWQDVFAPLPLLGTVVFDDSEAMGFLRWLRNDPSIATTVTLDYESLLPESSSAPVRGSRTTSRPWLPKLSKLEFDSVSLAEEEKIPAALLLLDLLGKRSALKSQGCPPMQVKFRRCDWFSRGDYEKELLEMPDVSVCWDEMDLEDCLDR